MNDGNFRLIILGAHKDKHYCSQGSKLPAAGNLGLKFGLLRSGFKITYCWEVEAEISHE